MTIKENNKGNGYVISLTGEGSNQKHKEKIILEAISKCLHEHPGESVKVVLTDTEILINTCKDRTNEEIRNQIIEDVKTTSKHHK